MKERTTRLEAFSPSQIQGLLLNLSRAGSSGTVYETTKITSKMLDAETSYMLDRYSRFVFFPKPSWFNALISVNRYSPAPISIKHLLEHGKTNDNLVGTIITG